MRFLDHFRRDSLQEGLLRVDSPSRAELIELWRRIIVGGNKSWVLFRHGTCVVFTGPVGDLRTEALELMREWGPVHAGSPAADFSVLTSPDNSGWVITSHHPDILTYVSPDEVSADDRQDVIIGLYGRTKRHQDAAELKVIHIEDRRDAA